MEKISHEEFASPVWAPVLVLGQIVNILSLFPAETGNFKQWLPALAISVFLWVSPAFSVTARAGGYKEKNSPCKLPALPRLSTARILVFPSPVTPPAHLWAVSSGIPGAKWIPKSRSLTAVFTRASIPLCLQLLSDISALQSH